MSESMNEKEGSSGFWEWILTVVVISFASSYFVPWAWQKSVLSLIGYLVGIGIAKLIIKKTPAMHIFDMFRIVKHLPILGAIIFYFL